MIYVNELSKEFGVGKNRETVLDGVSWTAANGSVTGLFGRKKSGKTATLRIITGIQSYSHGRVVIESKDISTEIVEARKEFGYVPDSTDQFHGLTGEEYLNFVADVYQVEPEKREDFILEYAPRLKVELELHHRMANYSKSVYKKMMLMGAMIYSPSTLILDNIFDGLDQKDMEDVKKILKEYAGRSKAVLVSDNKLSIAKDLCNHIIYMAKGKVIFEGSLSKLIEKYHELSSLELIDMKLSGELDAISEKVTPEPKSGLWGGK